MKRSFLLIIQVLAIVFSSLAQKDTKGNFPDGTKITGWFLDKTKVSLDKLGKQMVITNYGAVNDSLILQTASIQRAIDEASKNGGGVVVIPKGTFLSGALFFKPNTHLYIAEGGKLKGSDNIAEYKIMPSRMEGQNLDYFPALVNAYGVDGFTISGKGTLQA